MQENTERWVQLCELAAKEQNPQKLLELTREINSLLILKRQRLQRHDDKANRKATVSE